MLAAALTSSSTMAPRSPGAKKLKQSSLLGLFLQSTKCDSTAKEHESESDTEKPGNDIQAGKRLACYLCGVEKALVYFIDVMCTAYCCSQFTLIPFQPSSHH